MKPSLNGSSLSGITIEDIWPFIFIFGFKKFNFNWLQFLVDFLLKEFLLPIRLPWLQEPSLVSFSKKNTKINQDYKF